MIIDSHCHLVSSKFPEEEIPSLIERAHDNGVTQLVTLATHLGDCAQNLTIAEAYETVFTCVAIHPCDVIDSTDAFIPALRDFAKHEKCVAIGETGLDYFHPAPEGWTEQKYHQRQRDFLEQHFALAAELGKNIVIHTRDKKGTASLDDALLIYAKWADRVQAVFHCFLGPLENATRIFDLGGLISFTAISTFKSANDCSKAAADAPIGSFMLETDSPYLAPAPHRGKRCEPAYLKKTAEHIAHLRNETIEELCNHTTQTTRKFYNI